MTPQPARVAVPLRTAIYAVRVARGKDDDWRACVSAVFDLWWNGMTMAEYHEAVRRVAEAKYFIGAAGFENT